MLFKETSWTQLKDVLSKPKKGKESFAEYLSWDKERQLEAKDVGYYIVGEFVGNLRHNVEFKRRGTVTLDIDYPGLDFISRLDLCFGAYEYFWHTSRKSSATAPRIRVHLPLSRDITSAEEHEALSRLIASFYDIETVDKVSFVPAQVMFFSSVSSDGEFQFGENKGEWLDPDATLAQYIDWTDRAEWPRAEGEVPPETRKEKVDSPLTKPGVIGAFCRSHSITRVLEEVIPGIYEPAGEEGKRWRYYAAEGGGGAIIYDNDTALYSHHTNHDPAAGRSVNAFDLVRIHKFGSLDADVFEELKPTQMPSFLAMQEFAMGLPEVVRELNVVACWTDEEAERPSEPSTLNHSRVRPTAQHDDLDLENQGAEPTARKTPRPAHPVGPEAAAGAEDSATSDASALDSLPDLPHLPQGRPAASRARLRALIEEAPDADALVESVLPALAGAALEPAFESIVLREISDRHKELTGRPLEIRALRKSLAEIVKKMGVRVGTNGHTVESELLTVNEDGKIVNTVSNMKEWLACGAFGVTIVFDEFSGVPMMSPPEKEEWREITNSDYIDMRMAMERDGFTTFGGGNELVKMAVDAVARQNRFDSAQRWATSLLWDGVPRIDRSFPKYWGAPDNEYTRLAGAYMWTALAGRVLQPGVKADMAVILVGAQGLRKSSSVEALVPARDFYGILDLNKDDASRGRSMVGKLVMELGELRGFLNAKDEDGIKTFLTAGFDEWKPLYQERNKKHYRRCLFVATTDKQEFLTDISGNRRYLPIKINKTDVGAIARDREQLWAEAIERFVHGGVAYHVENVAADQHQQYMMSDLWDDEVAGWLELPAEETGFELDGVTKNGDKPFRSADLLKALGVQLSRTGRSEQIRIARILQRLGYESVPQWFKGKTANVWVKK
jgi:hypothetical protein